MRGPAVAAVSMLLGVVLAGCAVTASKAEYAQYRAVRVAPSFPDRLLAMQQYVAAYPQGIWIEAVRRERQRVEPRVWDSMQSSPEGLEFYLEVFPRGPHAPEARTRLQAFGALTGRRAQEAQQARAVRAEQRSEVEQERRAWLGRSMKFWLGSLLRIGNWGHTIDQVASENASFDAAFGGEPAPTCAGQACVKRYQTEFAIAVPGATRVDRRAELVLRLQMREGRLFRAELLLPNRGYSRWFELEENTLVIDEDPTQRAQAIEWAAEHVEPPLLEVAPTAERIDVVPEPIRPLGLDGADAVKTSSDDDSATELSLPVAVQGYQVGDLRIAVFAAAPAAPAPAFDGIAIEHRPDPDPKP